MRFVGVFLNVSLEKVFIIFILQIAIVILAVIAFAAGKPEPKPLVYSSPYVVSSPYVSAGYVAPYASSYSAHSIAHSAAYPAYTAPLTYAAPSVFLR